MTKRCGTGVGFYSLLRYPLPYRALLIILVSCTDDPKLYEDMPVSVQLVGRRNEDEKVIAIAKFLEENKVIGLDK